MNNTSHNLDIGEFRCLVVYDGHIRVPMRPPGSQERAYEQMDVSCLLIETGKQNILVDTGCGTGFQDTAGSLIENLEKEGMKPADIDTIVYTHGHVDHVGGTCDPEGKLLYPNARQIVTTKEWDSWLAKPETELNRHLFATARKNLLSIPDRFELVEDNCDIVPGIKLIPALGHTLGGVMVQINSGDDGILCIGDLIHSFLEFANPELYLFLDAAPEEALRLRTEGVKNMAESGVLVFSSHFPFPGVGHFVRANGNLGWQPVDK